MLVNLNGHSVKGAVSVPLDALPKSLRDKTWMRDMMSGEKIAWVNGVAQVALPAFGYTVLRIESKALPELPAIGESVAVEKRSRLPEMLKIKTRSGTLLVDPVSGFATVWQSDHRTFASGMDLVLPETLARLKPEVACRQTDDGIDVTRKSGGHTLALRYSKTGDGIEIRASWLGGVPQDAAVVFDMPAAAKWLAGTAEGTFESPFRVRHPLFDGTVGSIYRLPQGTAVAWDSRLHPFGLSAQRAWVGAEVDGQVPVFGFDLAALPAAVQLLDRVGADRGMKVMMAWLDETFGARVGGSELTFTLRVLDGDAAVRPTGSGDTRFTEAGGGWLFENAHYRAQISRNGALTGLWRPQDGTWRKIAGVGGLYTDHGFSKEDKRYAQENDVEASARIEKVGDGVRLQFCGEMRGFYRFDKMGCPIRFYTSFTFGKEPSFRQTLAFNASRPPVDGAACLAYLLPIEKASRVVFADAGGEFLKGSKDDGNARYAQTAKSAEPKRLPSDIRVCDANGVVLRMDDVMWFGAKPANIFMHGDQLHLAWMDGTSNCGGEGAWNGVSLSVACGEASIAPRDDVCLTQAGPVGLLRDGGFDQGLREGRVLVRSNRLLPQGAKSRSVAWFLPSGSEVVDLGNNRCVRVDGDGQEYRMIRQLLPAQVFRAGSKWRLSARLKGEGVEKAVENWKTVCLRWRVSAAGRTTCQTVSLPLGDSGWQDLSVEMTVPTDVNEVSAEAGLNGNKGRVWIDDVRVEELASK